MSKDSDVPAIAERLSAKIDNIMRDTVIDHNIQDPHEIAFIGMTALAHASARFLYMIAGPGENNHKSREGLRATFDNILMDAHAFMEKNDAGYAERTRTILGALRGVVDKIGGEGADKLRSLIDKIDPEKGNEENKVNPPKKPPSKFDGFLN